MEVIVAVGVLLMAVSASAGLVLDSLQSVNRAQNRVIAAYLAQEAIEVTRNIRDTNWIEGVGFSDGLNPGASDQCVDYDAPGDTLVNPCSNHALYWDRTPGVYTHDSGGNNELTIFERRINVQSINNPETPIGVDDILQVQATVSWLGPDSGSITVETRLYDWR